MEREQIIDHVMDMIANYYGDDKIEDYLKATGVTQQDGRDILEFCKDVHTNNEISAIAASNKKRYYIWLSLTIVTFLFFILVVPYWDTTGDTFFLSLLGSAATCIFGFHALAYRKSWEDYFVRKYRRPNIQYNFLIVFLLPCFILYFIISWRISAVQEDVLNNTQEEAVAHVVAGSSVEVKRVIGGGEADFSKVTVEFQTKDGKDIVATKDVPQYQFKRFYEGEEIRIIYSKINPKNIDLLNDESSVEKFRSASERDLNPDDLIHLMNSSDNTELELQKIGNGWQYDVNKDAWIDENKHNAIRISENELQLISENNYKDTYPPYLFKNGYILLSTKDTDNVSGTIQKIFQNHEFIIKISVAQGNSVVQITRKID